MCVCVCNTRAGDYRGKRFLPLEWLHCRVVYVFQQLFCCYLILLNEECLVAYGTVTADTADFASVLLNNSDITIHMTLYIAFSFLGTFVSGPLGRTTVSH